MKPFMKAKDHAWRRPDSVRKKILFAERLHRRYGENICTASPIGDLIEDYAEAIEETYRVMEEWAFPGICGVCAARDAGSCCFEGVEKWYDAVLLLINLLLGVHFPEYREIEGHCFFVGPGGCKLRARHAFCVNFLCPELRTRLGTERVSMFTRVAGNELFRGWKLEQAIRKSILKQERHSINADMG